MDFQDLKTKVTLEMVLTMLGIVTRKEQNQLRGKCPLTENASDRSFVVTPEKGLWYSFEKKEGGDMLKLVSLMKGLSVKESARLISDHFTADTETLKPIDYLDTSHDSVANLGLTAEVCKQWGAGYKNKGVLSGRFCIPIHNAQGKLEAYCGHAVKKGQDPVLAYPKGYVPTTFNLHRVTSETVYLTDNPVKVMVASVHGLEAVALLTNDVEVWNSALQTLKEKGVKEIRFL